MNKMYFIVIGSFILSSCYCVKVDVQGTLSIGKDIIDTISRYIGHDSVPLNSRRSLTPVQEDKITENVKMSILCRDLDFCQGDLRKFVDEYVIIQAKGIENILRALLGERYSSDIYDFHLKHKLEYFRIMLKMENEKVNENTDSDIWIIIVKKISAKFQEMALDCVSDILEINKKNIEKNLHQKLILATVIIEMKYLYKLCTDLDICVKSYECSLGLNTILEHLRSMPDEKVRLFIKYVYEALYDTLFYSYLNETTAHKFQVILNDMAYSSDVPVKELLSVVQKVVGARIEFITSNKDEKLSHDSLLMHVLLSDLDAIYSNKSNPFGKFLSNFFIWIGKDESFNLSKHIGVLLNEISRELSSIPNELFEKISREIRIFLELTVE